MYKPALLLLALVVVLGFWLRFYNLQNNPAGFFCDEASIGYNAYTILTTGKDQYGLPFPVFFESFGDYRPPLAIYSALPAVAFFGLTEFAVRLPSVIYGLLTIFIMYFLGRELFPEKRCFGIITAFVSATMPWLIHYNRTGFEFSIYAAFFSLAALLFLKAVRRKRYIIPAFMASALTLYTYQPARLLVPLLIAGILFIYRKTYFKEKRVVVLGLLSFTVISIPLVMDLLSGNGMARFNAVSVFSPHLPFFETITRVLYN